MTAPSNDIAFTPSVKAAQTSRGSRSSYARPEQALLFKVAAWAVNCPQHIPRKVNLADVAAMLTQRDAGIAAKVRFVNKRAGFRHDPKAAKPALAREFVADDLSYTGWSSSMPASRKTWPPGAWK